MGIIFRSQIEKNLQGKEVSSNLKKDIAEAMEKKSVTSADAKKFLASRLGGKTQTQISEFLRRKLGVGYYDRSKAMNLITPKKAGPSAVEVKAEARKREANIKMARISRERDAVAQQSGNSLGISHQGGGFAGGAPEHSSGFANNSGNTAHGLTNNGPSTPTDGFHPTGLPGHGL